jgi:hypothetical protein
VARRLRWGNDVVALTLVTACALCSSSERLRRVRQRVASLIADRDHACVQAIEHRVLTTWLATLRRPMRAFVDPRSGLPPAQFVADFDAAKRDRNEHTKDLARVSDVANE